MASHDSIQDLSESSSRIVYDVQDSNSVVDFDLAMWKPEHHLLITALNYSAFSKAMTAQASVPMAFVIEALNSFTVIDDNSFSFVVNGKRKRMTKSKFCNLLQLSVAGELMTPKNFEVFEVINEMGHIDLVNQASQVYLSKLPEIWALFYTLVINCLTGKVPSRGKINMNQMLIMYGIYHDVNVGVDEFIYNQFVSECRSHRVNEIVFHRYWSVIIDEVLKKDFPGQQWESLERMPIHSVTLPGKKQSSVVSPHTGQVSRAMLLRIPDLNEVLRQHRQNFSSFVYRDYDHTALFDPTKCKIINNVASLVPAVAQKRKADASASSPTAPKSKKKKSKKAKSAPALVDEVDDDEQTLSEPLVQATEEDLVDVSLERSSPALNVSEAER